MEKRFMEKVKIDKACECWEWTASFRGTSGYGNYWNRGTMERAHRVSHEFHGGDLTPGMYVMHICDNPKCVNPIHLVLGTPKQNTADCMKKGRNTFGVGEESRQHKLNNHVVRVIRKCREIGISQVFLASIFDIHQGTVSQIDRGVTWKHV